MKKYFLYGSMALLTGLTMVSCSKDGYQEVSRTLNASAITIITSESDGNVTASAGTYSFNIKMTDTENTGSVTSPELIADNTSLGFTTNVQKYSSTGYDAFLKNVTGTVGNSTMELNNADFLALYLYDATQNKYGYYYDLSNAGKYTFTVNVIAPWITLAKYNIGSTYRVNTFPVNSFFKGTTTTTYPSAEGLASHSTNDITYRFIVDAKENKAVLIVYNAKFSGSPAEPTKAAIIVEGLAVDFTPTGISITGENIVPDVVEGDATTPYESFTFNKISFHTTNDLYTEGVLDYTVATVFNGHFEGAYCTSYYWPGK